MSAHESEQASGGGINLPVDVIKASSEPPQRFQRQLWRQQANRWARWLSTGLALLLCSLLAIMAIALFSRAQPILAAYPIGELVFRESWHPMRGEFGFATFLVGTLVVTLIALGIAVPPAVLGGIYMAEYASRPMRAIVRPIIELLAGVPPVIYGLWGILVVVPFVRDTLAPLVGSTLGSRLPIFANVNPSGYTIFTAGFVLGMMVFPIIVIITEQVLRAIGSDLRLALFALGATRWEVARELATRAALPGVVAAIVLAFSRAFGETLAVLMLIGNIPRMPTSIFDSGYSLSGLIANNYGEMMSIPLYESALMSAAFLLLAAVLGLNIIARIGILRLIKNRMGGY